MRIIILLAVALTGCLGTVYPKYVTAAEHICVNHGGWAEISATRLPESLYARCADGTYISEKELTRE